VSEGCRNCYAEALHNKRHRAFLSGKQMPRQYDKPFSDIQLLMDRLRIPFSWRKPRMIFVGTMMDLFHPKVPDSYIARVFEVMSACLKHVFQVLTKRPERAGDWPGPWTENVWLGATVEHRKTVHRIDTLRQCKARRRFISFEPLIGPVGRVDLDGIHWAVVGGESGPKRRPMDQAWAREIRDQCVDQRLAFYFKQDNALRPQMRPFLVEEDGSRWEWRQYPGDLVPPRRVG
jgi:protein gp37